MKRNNPVAKYMEQFNRPATHDAKKSKSSKRSAQKRAWKKENRQYI